MLKTPCYFYVLNDKLQNTSKIWPLCLECGKTWPDAMFYDGQYGPWEYRCHNPLCPTVGGKVIWEGVVDSTV